MQRRPLSAAAQKSSEDGDGIRIAIIGAGASGLAAARGVQKWSSSQATSVTVFEQRSGPGGVWRYVHPENSLSETPKATPMYRNLRTNLPKECMAFREYPFDDEIFPESFVTHQQVQNYLEGYRDAFDIQSWIRYDTTVDRLELVPGQSSRLSVALPCPVVAITSSTTPTNGAGSEQTTTTTTEYFDAVFCCNGHYDIASRPKIPGLAEHYRGHVSHSKAYDTPAVWKDQTVLCIGGRASGSDLARELVETGACPHVYLSDSTTEAPAEESNGRLTLLPPTESVDADGRVHFRDTDYTCQPDAIIFCTGYEYDFPFLQSSSNSKESSKTTSLLPLDYPRGSRAVGPVLDQLWHAQYPNIAFIGLPHSVIPFPLFEIQVEAVCNAWQDASRLPKDDETAEPKIRVQDTHFLGGAQWDYCQRLAERGGFWSESLEKYLTVNRLLYEDSSAQRKKNPAGGADTYRSVCYQRHETSISSYPTLEAKRAAVAEATTTV